MRILDQGRPRGKWDDVVVGAGSAGAVLASRLSENPDRRVLLLEAGIDGVGSADASEPLGNAVGEGYNWDYSASIGEGAEKGRQYPYPVGKVVGGSSAVNGAIALRGLPADFRGWAAAGNREWAWDRVLPYFRKMEADADFDNAEHGTDGPIPIRRPAADEFGPAALAFWRACRTLGIPDLADLNGGGGIGVGPVPSNSIGGRRISTSDAYLDSARVRPNLTVWDRSHVSKVLLSGRRATGVEVLRDGCPTQVTAGRITLAAGGIGTPVILQRSGIGDTNHLASVGIRPVADLPGVGDNLTDHPVVTFWAVPNPGVCQEGALLHQVMGRLASAGDNPDLGLFLASNMTNVTVPVIGEVLRGRMAVAVSAMLLAPASRGTVCVPDPSLEAKPTIRMRLASRPGDVDALVRGARLSWSIMRSSLFSEHLQRVLMWTDRMVEDESLLRRTVGKVVAPMWHPTGTSRMGPPTDGTTVVDERCRVHQMKNLLVCDASVMPTIPSSPTNLSCIMLAERMAEWMD